MREVAELKEMVSNEKDSISGTFRLEIIPEEFQKNERYIRVKWR